MSRIIKLKPKQLKALVLSESKKLKDLPKKAKEVDADELADTLEKDVNHYRDLKEAEEKLQKKLSEVKKRKARVLKKIKSSK